VALAADGVEEVFGFGVGVALDFLALAPADEGGRRQQAQARENEPEMPHRCDN
jgi:hypothetical protein